MGTWHPKYQSSQTHTTEEYLDCSLAKKIHIFIAEQVQQASTLQGMAAMCVLINARDPMLS